MVIRTAKKGPHAGGTFYGCSRYPACKAIVPKSKPLGGDDEKEPYYRPRGTDYPEPLVKTLLNEEFINRKSQ
jgi:ssDNA-binding Zn-finger/Zn-ribbon topoisomerase 1